MVTEDDSILPLRAARQARRAERVRFASEPERTGRKQLRPALGPSPPSLLPDGRMVERDAHVQSARAGLQGGGGAVVAADLAFEVGRLGTRGERSELGERL